MRPIAFLKGPILVLAVLGMAAAAACAEELLPGPSLHGEYSILGALHRTGGAGDKALLLRGEFLTQELALQYENPLPAEWTLTGDVHLRHTNDGQIDPQDQVHVLDWTVELYNPTVRVTGGDFFADFSQYSITQSLKGVQVAVKTDTLDLKGVGGYSRRQDEGRQFFRWVAGGHSEILIARRFGFLKDWKIGSNFSDVEDDSSSIENDGSVPDASNRVWSFTSRAVLWDITEFESEFAKSWVDENTSPHLANLPRDSGTALRANTITRFSKMTKLRLNYEWVSTMFRTLAGSATPDRVNFSSRLDHKFNSEWSADASYRVFYDKLDKSTLNKRTRTHSPRVALNWTPAAESWFFKNYYQTFYGDYRSRVSDDDPSGQTDFVTDEFGTESDFQIQNIRWNWGWAIREEDDDRQKVNDRLTNSGFIGMRIRDKLLSIDAEPSLRYQFDYQDITKEEGRDLLHTVSQGLKLYIREGLKFEERFSISPASRLRAEADSIKWNGYLGIEYQLPTQPDLTLKVSYEHTGFAHSISTQRFSENNFQAQLLWKF